jgi:hypothetical protein
VSLACIDQPSSNLGQVRLVQSFRVVKADPGPRRFLRLATIDPSAS